MARVRLGLLVGLVLASVAASPPCAPPVSCWAIFGRTPAYRGGYVGGGSACRGDGRAADEGTWGWDYEGLFCLRKVFLKWSHGRRYQGGEGAYKTDGPRVPNVLAVPPASHEKKH